MAKHIGAEQSCGTVDALYIGIKGAVKNLSSGKPIMAIRFTANGCNLSSDLQKYWPIRFSFLYTARCLIGTKLELKRQIYTESLVTLRCFPESFLWSGSFFFKDAESHNACHPCQQPPWMTLWFYFSLAPLWKIASPLDQMRIGQPHSLISNHKFAKVKWWVTGSAHVCYAA